MEPIIGIIVVVIVLGVSYAISNRDPEEKQVKREKRKADDFKRLRILLKVIGYMVAGFLLVYFFQWVGFIILLAVCSLMEWYTREE